MCVCVNHEVLLFIKLRMLSRFLVVAPNLITLLVFFFHKYPFWIQMCTPEILIYMRIYFCFDVFKSQITELGRGFEIRRNCVLDVVSKKNNQRKD